MRVVITGGAGFVGRAVVERLGDRGDEIVALVRDPETAPHLRRDGVTIVASSLAGTAELAHTMRSADVVIHAAGSYRIGIAKAARPAMWEANVATTERVLDAAIAAGVPRIVHVSTVNVLGDTNGAVLDETSTRDESRGFLSWYDETKFRAHEVAEARIAEGAPIVIVMPSQVYGPYDHSLASEQLHLAFLGTLPYRAFGSLGTGWVHVHDLANGILAATDAGRAGQAYCLAGPNHRMDESVAIAAHAGGHRVPRLVLPTMLARVAAPVNDALGGLPGMPASLRETISASDGVTYWASHAKAERELGFAPRSLWQGVRDTWERR
jgi:dihydroflavonol-4-reductase